MEKLFSIIIKYGYNVRFNKLDGLNHGILLKKFYKKI